MTRLTREKGKEIEKKRMRGNKGEGGEGRGRKRRRKEWIRLGKRKRRES